MSKSFSTHEQTTDQNAVVSGGGYLCSILIITNGTDDATVIVYDTATVAAGAASNKLYEGKVLGASNYGGRDWTYPVRFDIGLSVDVTGTGASYIVEYTR